MTEITPYVLMCCALHPDTWNSWIPQEVLDKIPFDTRISISCTPNSIWIIANDKHEVLWSSEPVTIIDDNIDVKNMLAMLYATVLPVDNGPKAA
jgi:hypothetical protein